MNAKKVIQKIRDRCKDGEVEEALSKALGRKAISSIRGGASPEVAIMEIHERCQKSRAVLSRLSNALGSSIVHDLYQAAWDTEASGRYFTEKEIDAMSDEEYLAKRDAIGTAMSEGLIR